MHFHGGPYAGEWHEIYLGRRTDRMNADGTVLGVDTHHGGRHWVGRYVQDQQSDRGQDWDWEE